MTKAQTNIKVPELPLEVSHEAPLCSTFAAADITPSQIKALITRELGLERDLTSLRRLQSANQDFADVSRSSLPFLSSLVDLSSFLSSRSNTYIAIWISGVKAEDEWIFSCRQ